MHKALISLLIVALLLFSSGAVTAAQRVTEFRGTGNTTTAIFRVDSPWLLDWRLNGDYDQLMALDIMLIDARTGKHVGRVLHTKRTGNGVKLFRSSGLYQLRISSTLARWAVKIDQITAEEAEAYTPR